MTLNIKPIEDRVYVLPDKISNETQSGLVLLESSLPKPLTGTIVAKGDGMYSINTGELIPMKTKLGDRVTYPSHAGYPTNVDGNDYLIMKEGEIFAII